jgi:uncharacterized protein YggT (Ycf19 family)
MENIIRLIENTVSLYILILFIFTMLRMFIMMASTENQSKFETFVFSTTEPVVFPVRMILSRFEIFQAIPIDCSLMVTSFILLFVKFILDLN